MGTPRKGLSGVGALFFLGTLGAIAFYVQQQSAPEAYDGVRKSATVLPDVTPDDGAPLVLPWEDRLDLSAATLVQISDPAQPPTPGDAQAPAADAVAQSPAPANPKSSRFVQDLPDGHRIMLTLDPVLQESALTIFQNREVPYAGAVMLDVRDNAVLVLAGHSSMDPEVDPVEVVASAWAPAASTFKLVTTAALLESGKVTPSTRACFSGGLHGIEDDMLLDDPARDTRCETLSSAVAHSYNLVIGKLALEHLEQQSLVDIAHALQFETQIPFEYTVERSPAHIPADPMERAKVAAGFWNVDLSPVHAATMASIFARGGVYQPPHIIDQVVGPEGDDLTPARPKPTRTLSSDAALAVGEMMKSTTTSGTARKSFVDPQGKPYIPDVVVAGKTGSLTGKRAPYLNYNWFIGFAPADRPEIAFAVLLANEPKWRIKAHYAARRLVQIYLERRDALERNRDARLTETGVQARTRDAMGAIVKAAPAPSDTPPAEPAATPSTSPTPAAAEVDALPPPPGPVPAEPTPGA
ncbi:MAG: penicillin-binding transpeptidase domain-containing protein [Nannocystaceae bacterium]|nr:penicillin-binding transpeptidase domain-containing protein [bacterium]